MFMLLLKLSGNGSRAAEIMNAQHARPGRGFDDEAFLLAGSMQPGLSAANRG